MIRVIFLLFISYSLNAIDLNFEQRQNLIYDIKQTIVNEEIISQSIENYIKTEYKLPYSLSDLNLDFSSLDEKYYTYFNNYSIDATNQNLIINYNLKVAVDDTNLISLYESNTFRDRTFFYISDNIKTIRVILNDDLSRHIYGLIRFNGDNILKCTESIVKVCFNDDIKSVSFKFTDGTDFLYEYKIENYRSGPMTVTSNTTLHTSSEFDFVPNGVSLIDENGIMYVKTDDGIKTLQ